MKQIVIFFIMCMNIERSRLKTSEEKTRKTLKNYNPHIMIWDLNKYRRLLDPKMKFIDKYIYSFKINMFPLLNRRKK